MTPTAQAGITKTNLKDLSFKLESKQVKKVKVCGLDENHKKTCDSFSGAFLKNNDNQISTLKGFEFLEDQVLFDGQYFAAIEGDDSLILNSDISCDLRLSKYRYTD